MVSVLYVHWDEEEAAERAQKIRKANFSIRVHWQVGVAPKVRAESMPDALVISLDRLPSHGHSIAEWFWEPKSRQGLPIVFSGGAAPRVESTRALFPGAIYCRTGEEVTALRRIFR